ncbi:MAG: hypothetical protein ILO68_07180 [Clostridia bacterium]|nr:hypothetical protein [Clostridia bacterium]
MANLKSLKNLWIRTDSDLSGAVEEFGFLPYFRCGIPGFSIEEHADPAVWFSSEPGIWEWKGPVIRKTGCAYGKFFRGNAGFVSRAWFPDFANYRRDGYDFDARYDDGLASFREKELFDLIERTGPALSRDLKREGNYGKNGKKGFDGLLTALQRQTYVLISDFVYDVDRDGNPFGWGVSEYATPEKRFGDSFRESVYLRTPEASLNRIAEHLRGILPDAGEAEILNWLKK